MFKKIVVLSALLLFSSASYATAACTAEEVQAKAQAFQQAAIAAAQKDPQKYQDAMTAIQKDIPELQKSANTDALCKFYDDWTAKLK